MKARLLTTLCVLAIGWCGGASSYGANGLAVVADVVVVRPACLAATVVGSVFFVVSLPIAAISKSVNQTAETLVVKPAEATFTRPLGDFTNLED